MRACFTRVNWPNPNKAGNQANSLVWELASFDQFLYSTRLDLKSNRFRAMIVQLSSLPYVFQLCVIIAPHEHETYRHITKSMSCSKQTMWKYRPQGIVIKSTHSLFSSSAQFASCPSKWYQPTSLPWSYDITALWKWVNASMSST